MTRKLGLTSFDLTSDSQYQNPVTLSRGYETDGKNSQRDSINEFHKQLTGRQFSNYWQYQGVSIELISALQYTRFIVDSAQEVIGRDIFLRDYEIEPSIIWAIVFNCLATGTVSEFEFDGRHIAGYRTETGKRTYHGEPSDGMMKLKAVSHNRKTYKRNRKVNF